MPALLGVQTTENWELEQLLLRVGRGDREAFAQLYAQTKGAVYALALSLLHNAQEAQDVFVRVWESAPAYRPQGSPMAWLLTIARNLARSRLRRNGRQVWLDEEAWNAIPAQTPDVEDRQLLQDALGELGVQERQVILLHAAAGLKHREIARLLELPLSTVLSKYHRGLKKLKALMKGESDR